MIVRITPQPKPLPPVAVLEHLQTIADLEWEHYCEGRELDQIERSLNGLKNKMKGKP